MDVDLLKSQADKAYKEKEYENAAEKYIRIADYYQQLDDHLNAAENSNNASVAYLMGGKPDASLQAALGTEIVFFQAGDEKRKGIALSNQAAAYEAMGDLKMAVQIFQQAADSFKVSHEKEYLSFVLKQISSLQIRLGKQLEALGSMHVALQNAPKLSVKEKTLKQLTNWVIRLIQRG